MTAPIVRYQACNENDAAKGDLLCRSYHLHVHDTSRIMCNRRAAAVNYCHAVRSPDSGPIIMAAKKS